MATTAELERRLRKVEQAIATLTRPAQPSPDPKSAWYVEQAGAFADDPVFDEIVRLGQEVRDAQRPKPRGRRR